MVTTMMGLIATSVSLMLYDRHMSRQAMIDEHQVLLEVIAHRSTAVMAFRDQRGGKQNLEALAQQKSIVLACLYDAKGHLFLGMPVNEDCPQQSPDHSSQIQNGFLHIYQPIQIDDKPLGEVYAKASLNRLSEKLEQLGWVTLIIVVVVAMAAFLMTSGLQKLISKPIILLSQVSRRVSEDNDYSRRAEYVSSDELGLLVNSFNSMMTTIEKAQQELKNLAFKDGLTDLPNRRAFMATFEQALVEATSEDTSQDNVQTEFMALFLVDLDGFKAVNDQLGHEAGDWVLTVVSERLRTGIRSEDAVARLGGDEFTVLLRNVKTVENVSKIAQKICHLIDAPIYYNERLAKVSSSIGISLVPLDGCDPHVLFKLADEAMYAAKKAGKNGFVFGNRVAQSQAHQEKLPSEQVAELLSEHRLCFWAEPQYQIENKTVVGAELLVYQTLSNGGCERLSVDWNQLVTEQALLDDYQSWLFTMMLKSVREAGVMGVSRGIKEPLVERKMRLTIRMPTVIWQCSKVLPALKALDEECQQADIKIILPVEGQDFRELLPVFQSLAAQGLQQIALAYDVNINTEFNVEQLSQYAVQQIRFSNKFEDTRVEDKKMLSETRGYLNMVLVELCQHLKIDSVALNLTHRDQLNRLAHLNCEFGQGKLLADPLPWQQFMGFMDKHRA